MRLTAYAVGMLLFCSFLYSATITELVSEIDYDNQCVLSFLALNDIGVTEIEGLSHWTNLSTLLLSGNEIEEIGGLDDLYRLTGLDLSRNKIRQIRGLESLTNLVGLNLVGNQIEHIDHLECLPSLEHLFIYNNPIKTMSRKTYRFLMTNNVRLVHGESGFMTCAEGFVTRFNIKIVK